MTLTAKTDTDKEEGEQTPEKQETTPADTGLVLVEVLKQAVSQGRITFGVFECADLLETAPEQIMLCVLPTGEDADMTVNIQHKLIEAHCWENAVNVVKVDSSQKLTALLTSPEMKKTSAQVDRTWDFSCLLVGFPVDEMSADDFHITKYSYLYSENPQDVIQLPG